MILQRANQLDKVLLPGAAICLHNACEEYKERRGGEECRMHGEKLKLVLVGLEMVHGGNVKLCGRGWLSRLQCVGGKVVKSTGSGRKGRSAACMVRNANCD